MASHQNAPSTPKAQSSSSSGNMSGLPNTPITSKRELSNSSTPSPLSVAQPPKKAKKPGTSNTPTGITKTKTLVEPVSQPPASTNLDTQNIIQSVMSVLNSQVEDIKATITDQINAGIAAMAQSVADMVNTTFNDRIKATEDENRLLKDQIHELKSELASMRKTSDSMEQYSRRNCLRISGVAESYGENTDDIVLNIAKSCNVELTLNDIDRSHRLNQVKRISGAADDYTQRPRDIIVKFSSYRSRSAFYRGKSALKNCECFSQVYVNEDLTKLRAEILRSARQLVKNKNSNITNAWSRDGRVYVKFTDGSIQMIVTKSDLVKNN